MNETPISRQRTDKTHWKRVANAVETQCIHQERHTSAVKRASAMKRHIELHRNAVERIEKSVAHVGRHGFLSSLIKSFLARLHEVHRAIVVTSVVRVYVYVYVCVRVTLSVKVF